MGFIILDLEFNNLREITKYYPELIRDENQEDLENEIIEIGAVKYDVYMREQGEFKCYIKPTILPVLNPRVLEITGIKEEDLQQGLTFREAMEKLRDFAGENNIICSWAKDDIAEIVLNSSIHGYSDLSWIDSYLDIQEYVTKVLAHKKSLSLHSALEELRIRVNQELLHDALYDAKCTAQVFKRLYNSRVIKNYIVKDVYTMPSIMIRDFKDIKLEEEKTELVCPRCHLPGERETALQLFSWRFLSLGHCSKCRARLLQEVVVKKNLTGEKLYSNNTTIISEVDYQNYYYKFKEIV